MRIAAAITCAMLIGCASSPPRRPRARRPPASSAFALRPLSITVEGTSPRRPFGDPVFLGIHVTVKPFESDRQTYARAMTRFMRLPVVSVPDLMSCDHLRPDCMAVLGKRLGARVIIWGHALVHPASAEVGILVRALDVEQDEILARYEELLPLASAHAEGIQQMVERARHAVLAGEESVLLVESELEGTLIVDTDRRLPLVRPRTRIPIAKGAHVVAVESRGYARTERVVEVPAGFFVRIVVKK